MSLLIVALPPDLPGPACNYAWATSADGQTPTAQGQSGASLLPPAGRGVEVVVMVPAARLSWHQVSLPRGVGVRSPRLRAILEGLLEDKLLTEPETLHFALGPQPGSDRPSWVASCQRDWLHAHMNALENAGRSAARIVPELEPQDTSLSLGLTGEPERAQLLASGAPPSGGVFVLPLEAGVQAWLRKYMDESSQAVERWAEPAVAALAERILGTPLTLVTPAEQLLRASRSAWDLAQLELARGGRARASRRAGASWRDFVHAPRWRPLRWGLAALVLSQLVGLNLWTRQTQHQLAVQKAQVHAMLTRTFPHVPVVVDAPLQMEREVAALRQATGAASPRDLAVMLAVLAQVMNFRDLTPATYEFSPGELRLRGPSLPAETLADARDRLRAMGYQLSVDAEGVLLQKGAGT